MIRHIDIAEFEFLASNQQYWPLKTPVPMHYFPANGTRPAPPRFEIVSDGDYAIDGGQVYSDTPRSLWDQLKKPDRRNRVTQGLNLLLLQLPGLNALIDTGLGHIDPVVCREVYRHTTSKLNRTIRAAGVSARDVDLVILSHMHIDHSGGTLRMDRAGDVQPMFPRATIMVQEDAWTDAMAPTATDQRHYSHRGHLQVLQDKGKLQLQTRDGDVGSGIWTVRSEGHGPGHQIVLANYGNMRLAYLADLAPTPEHLLSGIPYGPDLDRDRVMQDRRDILTWLAAESWLCVFPHSADTPAGYLNVRHGELTFLPIVNRHDLIAASISARRTAHAAV